MPKLLFILLLCQQLSLSYDQLKDCNRKLYKLQHERQQKEATSQQIEQHERQINLQKLVINKKHENIATLEKKIKRFSMSMTKQEKAQMVSYYALTYQIIDALKLLQNAENECLRLLLSSFFPIDMIRIDPCENKQPMQCEICRCDYQPLFRPFPRTQAHVHNNPLLNNAVCMPSSEDTSWFRERLYKAISITKPTFRFNEKGEIPLGLWGRIIQRIPLFNKQT